jgi:carbamoyl-phosphate synthase large subunit
MEGRPHIVDMIKNGEVSFIINTTEGSQAIKDSYTIRRSAMQYKVSYKTTLAGGKAAVLAMAHDACKPVRSLQSLYLKQAHPIRISEE